MYSVLGGTVSILAGADDILAQLEESQVTIGTIRGSRYVNPIRVSSKMEPLLCNFRYFLRV